MMNSICTSLAANGHFSARNNETLLIEEFQGARKASGDYRNPVDESFTRATRKRNRKRTSLKVIEVEKQEVIADSELTSLRSPLVSNQLECKNLDSQNPLGSRATKADLKGTRLAYGTQSDPLISGSYAAVVSGRNSRDIQKSNSLSAVTENNDFLPLVGSSAVTMSMLGTKPFPISSGSKVQVRDVGIQVNIQGNTAGYKGPTKSRNQWTMTNRKVQCRDKFVLAKICCNDDETSTSRTPPVEFLGTDFTFESALAKTVAQLGIEFIDWKEDSIIQTS